MSNSQYPDPNASEAHESDYNAIFVEKDCVERSGRLMCSFTFLNDPLVGTKHDLSSTTIPEEKPTFVRKQLIAYIEPESLSFLDAVCRTASMLQRSPSWARLSLTEVQRLFHVAEDVEEAE